MKRNYVVALLCIGVFGSFSCDSPPPDDDAGAPDAGSLDAFVAECETDEMCDDGLFCTGVESCEAGRCVSTGAVDCDDGVECTLDECDEEAGMCTRTPPDADEDGQADAACLGLDGAPLGPDCDDTDPNRFVGNVERCDADNRDEDCDPSTFGLVDTDGDGFPAARCCNEDSDGQLLCGSDCDDNRRAVQPDSPEVCNGLDDDCDGDVDEGVSLEGFVDEDHDGYGGETPRVACAGAVGFATRGGDCDDANPTRHPDQIELCDGLDNDCDPRTDEDSGPVTWYRDADQDLFGAASSGTVEDCADRRPEYSLQDTDCDDGRAGVNPAQGELCNGIDDDCNGVADFAIGVNDFEDDDGDGSVDLACGPPLGEDCDDGDASTSAGSAEICDGRDNDCDENVDEGATGAAWYLDVDGDGWGSERSGAMISCEPIAGRVARAGDCDDSDSGVSPDAPEICDGLDNDCNGAADDAAAFSSCSLMNASSVCLAGACRVETCVEGFDDCNGVPSDGCEAPTGNVGSCGCGAFDCASATNVDVVRCERAAPGLPYACVLDEAMGCDANFGDCDGSALTGCETPTDRSPLHCGECNNVCPNPPGATALCLDGGCLGVCLPGFLDCEGATPGCETNVRTTAHCGSCNNDCNSGHASVSGATCETGPAGSYCRVSSCNDANFADCNGDFVDGCETDTTDHPAHCGGCNVTCFGAGMECLAGDCVCESDRADCDASPGCETDIFSDRDNCGGCAGAGGEQCESYEVCQNGSCECPFGSADCNGLSADGCEANLDSSETCGSCLISCGAGNGCQNQACVSCGGAAARFQDCSGNGGCDTDTDFDRQHCGGCNMPCQSNQDCVSGTCECQPGFADCDGAVTPGCEVDALFDSDNCNGCAGAGGIDCGPGGTCNNGTCSLCSGPSADCNRFGGDGCEVNLGNEQNCGGCGDTCAFEQFCDGGTCQCPAGTLDCDGNRNNGCEAFEFDPANCLGCTAANVCDPGEWCAMAGGCTTCPMAFTADCNFDGTDGCETPTRDNPDSCGGCNIQCGSGQDCSEGVCCADHVGQCDGDMMCNDDLLSDSNNCGECGNSCGPGGTCANGACDGIVDVKVGSDFSCALHSAGGVTCWGDNSQGQLGNNGAPEAFGAVALPDDAVEIALGSQHACAILADGEVWCWGRNNAEGRIGNGTVNNIVLSPVHVSAGFGPAIAITAGENHTCAVEGLAMHTFNAGHVWCWGRDVEGQLGTAGASANSSVPVMATDSGGFDNFERIAAGGDFTCGSAGGSLSCWGADGVGQMGNGGLGANQSPTDLITVGVGIDELVAGHFFACARDFSQRLFCWGSNSIGQVVPGGPSVSPAPQLVRDPVIRIGGGREHRSWVQGFNVVNGVGRNSSAQLGDGTTTTPSGPVGPSETFDLLASGPLADHSCGVDSSQRILCWGLNGSGRAVPGMGAVLFDPTQVVLP